MRVRGSSVRGYLSIFIMKVEGLTRHVTQACFLDVKMARKQCEEAVLREEWFG